MLLIRQLVMRNLVKGMDQLSLNKTGHNLSNSLESNGLQFLSQVISMYPGQWNVSSRRLLLMDVAVLGKENNAVDLVARIHRLKEALLLPLARIILNEKEAMKLEREKSCMKEQQLHAAFLALQEEKEKILERLQEETDELTHQNMFIETLLEDMEMMAKASDQHKKVIQQLQHTLLVKDLEIQKLQYDKEELLTRIMTGGKALCEWSKADLQAESFKDNCVDWGSPELGESPNASDCNSSISSNNSSTLTSVSSLYNVRQPLFGSEGEKGKTGILQLVLHELLSSLQLIEESGIFSVPSAVMHFWSGLAGRIADHVAELILLKVRQSALGFCFQLL